MLPSKIVTALLASALVLLIVASSQAHALDEVENLRYVAKIIDKLNNKEKCELPTYAEIDALQTSFDELNWMWLNWFGLDKASRDEKLSADQKLVLSTVLDQWTSFQRYLTGESVTASAKKRSFLNKVERYQVGKYGFSICTQNPDDSAQKSDGEYEKNSLVRYVKQLKTDGPAVDAPEATREEGKEGKEGKEGTNDAQDSAGSQGGPNGNDPFADEPDVVFKFKVHPGDDKQNVRQYAGKFTYRDGQTPHRITLNIHNKQ